MKTPTPQPAPPKLMTAMAAAMETKVSNIAIYIGRLQARGAWPYRRAGRGKARAS